jgi:hypothetical protein
LAFISAEDSTDDFVAYLRSSGVESTIVRRVYNYLVYNLKLAMAYPYGTTTEDIAPFFQVGFTELDNEGFEELTGKILCYFCISFFA